MRPRFFTKTFSKFFFGFLCILGVAFAVMVAATQYAQAPGNPSQTSGATWAP